MARKRAKLEGQGIKAFFSEPTAQTDQGKKTSSDKRKRRTGGRKKKAAAKAVPTEFQRKVQELKEKIQQFKVLIRPDEFSKMTIKDLER